MVGPTRNKLREAASQPLRSPRSPQSRRRRRVTGAGEPEVEEEPQEEVEKSEQPLPVGGGNLPGGARRYSPRRTRNLKAQNCMQMEMVTKTLFLRRFQFLRCYLEQLLDQVHLLRRRQFSGRATICVAAFLGLLHWIHLVTLFENDRHFSHLSSLEREMTFRTEMGLYYSYFKTIMEAPSFLEGLWMVMNDRLTEYPLVINTVKRFHLYPEATRVMWTPPLRESFSYPFLVLQMFILTMILRTSNSSRTHFAALCLSNVAFMLPWQFAQFILFTQIASLFPMFVVGYIEPKKFQKIIYMNMMSVLLCFVLMFGNPMYLSSYYSSSLLMTWVIILKRNKIQRLGVSELNFWLIQGCGWFCGTIILKFLTSKILGVSDHIRLSDLIAARILRFTDFDTLIYTCAPEFDFMEKATPMRYTKTLLLPVVMVITYFIFKKTFRDTLCVLSANTYLRKQLLEHGELIFHTLQLLAFAALAILIMRLKLFLTPHMCVMASLICSRRLFGWLFCRVRFENVIFGILTVMSLQGSVNLHNQWSIIGEFNNLPQEELIEWIQYNTRPDAVFAGAMPIMASVKLSTLHPIVNHPHYEDADLRARTKIVYSIYSRKSAKEVRDKLLELHVNYYILEEAWCVVRTNVQFLTRSYQTCKTKGHCDQYSGRKPGCSMLEIWDVEDPSNAASPPLCSILLKNERPYFSTVFQNSVYRVLKVN
ncbi:PREDICTED: probable C-mannosyltransferase DPY19L2 isoform X2 [Hipposideros armiger]|uniref:Probable C-mannosyltransferase DPY19L2 isoform X2 n=1 Tax=Hipposideros armiger TaxID=186990 RepID=A0A8B7SEX9_HIPAR|nr:PREDICTED: probable C-mannosyltransferase DPY19L2 isoform X2 [Hipposideros armiger]